VTVFPAETTLLAGRVAGGNAASLAADDGAYFAVSSGFLTSPSWYGSFAGVPAGATNLRVGYVGRGSRTCTLSVSIYSWATGDWSMLAQQSVGTTDVVLADLVPPGAASSFRSTSGEVLVRVTCSLFTFSTYQSLGDRLSLTYDG
jgi:hypothetical protein